ncbi:ATP-binding cassette domain-containing protein [Candidatus Margulisiibacteriota bacterium]
MAVLAIEIDCITKKFNKITAVDNISLNVEQGELFGLLGPNGAGKTTTISMLSTLINPTSGQAKVASFGITNNKKEVRKNIGIVFQDPSLDLNLTGRENLEFHAMLYGLSRNKIQERINEVLSLIDLEADSKRLVSTYSGGMKRRLEIARGLIHRPKILFLDEPTLGLDAHTRRNIWDYIKILNQEHKVTIILTTHYMEEADFLCHRIGIIDKGKIIALNSPGNLKDILGGDIIALDIKGNTEEFKNELENTNWIKNVHKENSKLLLTVEQGETKIAAIVNMIRDHKCSLKAVNLHKPSLEDVFLHFTGRKINKWSI